MYIHVYIYGIFVRNKHFKISPTLAGTYHDPIFHLVCISHLYSPCGIVICLDKFSIRINELTTKEVTLVESCRKSFLVTVIDGHSHTLIKGLSNQSDTLINSVTYPLTPLLHLPT